MDYTLTAIRALDEVAAHDDGLRPAKLLKREQAAKLWRRLGIATRDVAKKIAGFEFAAKMCLSLLDGIESDIGKFRLFVAESNGVDREDYIRRIPRLRKRLMDIVGKFAAIESESEYRRTASALGRCLKSLGFGWAAFEFVFTEAKNGVFTSYRSAVARKARLMIQKPSDKRSIGLRKINAEISAIENAIHMPPQAFTANFENLEAAMHEWQDCTMELFKVHFHLIAHWMPRGDAAVFSRVDVLQTAAIALVTAINEYDAACGKGFLSFAKTSVRRSLKEMVVDGTIPLPIGKSVGDVFRTPDGGTENVAYGEFIPVDESCDHDVQGRLNTVLTSLSDRERRVLEFRFGLVDGFCRTLEETAKMFNLTRERVRQIQDKALSKLNAPARRRLLKMPHGLNV